MRSGGVAVALMLALAACADRQEPRRSSPASTPATDAGDRVAPRSLEQIAVRYQRYGFLEGESKSAAAKRLGRALREAVGEPPPKSRQDELVMLAGDGRDGWFADIESDVGEGNREYVRALRDWARASRGTFQPTRITERWLGPEGPVRIAYTERGRRRVAMARGLDDYLDMCVLVRDVNRVTIPRGRQFELYRPDEAMGQQVFAAALTPREKAGLERIGWRFATPADVDAAYGAGSGSRASPATCQP